MADLTKILDKDTGAELRAGVQIVSTLAGSALTLLQTNADALNSLPHWPWVMFTLGITNTAIVYVGRFTKFFNKVGDHFPKG